MNLTQTLVAKRSYLTSYAIAAITVIGMACFNNSGVLNPTPELAGMRLGPTKSLEMEISSPEGMAVYFREPDIALTAVFFNTQTPGDFSIQVSKLLGNPLYRIGQEKVDVYQYIQVNLRGEDSTKVKEATLNFSVDKK